MAENIGEAVVKITGDITPLQSSVKKAETLVNNLNKEFKITYMGEQTFDSFEEYTKAIEKQNQEWAEYQKQQEELAQTNQVVSESFEQATTSVNQLNDSVSKTTTTAETATTPLQGLVGSVKNFGKQIQASVLDAKVAIIDAGRVGQTALVGLATAFTMLGKGAIKEYAKYNKDAADTQERLEKSVSKVKASIGMALSPILNAVAGVAEWASKNQQLVTGVTTMIGVLAGGAGLIALVSKLGKAIAALKVTAGSIIGILSLIAGVVASAVLPTANFDKTLEETAKDEKEMEEATKKLNQSMAEMNETIAEAQKGLADARFEYEQSLKKMLVTHEKTVDTLTQQLKDANEEYKREIDERNASFLKSQAKEEEEHQKKVDELTAQLNFLQRYNNKYNAEKLEAVQMALAREEALYKKKTQSEKNELDLQNEYSKKKYEEKRIAYQKELDDEKAFLAKHAEAFKSVRNTILLDEKEMLDRQYQATVANYNKQIVTAKQKGAEAGTAYAKAYVESAEIWSKSHDLKKLQEMGYLSSGLTTINGKVTRVYVQNLSSGGYTGRGGKYEVADDVQVHRGEYVLPQEMVDQDTGLPKSLGNNITINVSGVFATSDLERRRVAEQIVDALQQTNYARMGV